MNGNRKPKASSHPGSCAIQHANPWGDHLADFLTSRKNEGCDHDYTERVRVRVEVLLRACKWSLVRDINPNVFVTWRNNQTLAAKTLNHYLDAMNTLLNWLQRQGCISTNPLRCVGKLQVDGHEKVRRRALTDNEVIRLLDVAGPYRITYLAALLTGLRRNELRLLEWGDVHLDVPRPFLSVRASTTKNGKDATLWLRDDLADALRSIRPAYVRPLARVLRMPSGTTLAAHLKAAGIARYDNTGRKIDLHTMRHTFGTNLSRVGVTPRVTMEMMRHSDLRLTMKTYTDGTQLPTMEALAMLPRFDAQANTVTLATGTAGIVGNKTDTKMRSQTPAPEGRFVSQTDTHDQPRSDVTNPQIAAESRRLSQSDTGSPERETSGEGGIRTPGDIAATHDFQSCTLSRSATSPGWVVNTTVGATSGWRSHRAGVETLS